MSNTPLMAIIPPAKPTDLENFFGQLMPAEGNFRMLMIQRGGHKTHESFETIAAITNRVIELEAEAGVEVYHAVASFNHHHDEKKDHGLERWGRKGENVAYVSAFFLDIDVADDKPSKAYVTIEQAVDGLARFVESFGIPYSYLIRSGSGLHVYWFLDVDVARDKWCRVATKFKDVTKALELLADPSRTADPTSLLRPVGTTNRKAKYGPSGQMVEGSWCRFGRVRFEDFDNACMRALEKVGAVTTESPLNLIGTSEAMGIAPKHWFDDLTAEAKLCILRSMLNSLPAEWVADYDSWVKVGAWLADEVELPRQALFNLWAAWSKSTEKGRTSWQHQPEAKHRRKWNGFNRGSIGSLIYYAKRFGWVAEPSVLDRSYDELQVRYKTVEHASIAISKTYAYARLLDKFISTDGAVLSVESFNRSLARTMPLDRNGKPMPAEFIAIKLGASTHVDAVGYAPGEEFIYVDKGTMLRMANRYQHHAVAELEPVPGEIKLLDYFRDHIVAGDEDTRRMLHYWDQALAYLVQHPRERIPKVFLLIGEKQGSGKSTFTLGFTRALFGWNNVAKVSNSEIRSGFNEWMVGGKIVCLEEIWMPERKDSRDLVNSLKDNITDGIARIHPKGSKGYQMTNPATYLASSNHLDAVDLADGDRRWVVAHTKAGTLNQCFAQWLYRWLEVGSRGPGVLQWIYRRKSLAGFNPHTDVPHSQAKLALMDLSQTEVERCVFEGWISREGPFALDLTTLSDIRQYLALKQRTDSSDKQIQLALQVPRVGAIPARAKKEREGKTLVKRLWILRDKEFYRSLGPARLYDAYAGMITQKASLAL